MPALVWCGRRWRSGTDDFYLLPLLFAGVRLMWLCLTFAAFGPIVGAFDDDDRSPSADGCGNSGELEVFFVGITATNLLSVVQELFLVRASSRGGVFEVDKRRCVPRMLYCRLAVWVADVIMAIYGTVSVIHQQSCVEGSVAEQVIADGLLISQWTCVGVVLCAAAASYDPLGRRVYREGLLWRQTEEYQRLWASRVRKGLCCADAEREAFEEVAQLFAEMFGNAGVVDLVPSDVAMGLLLLRKRQKRRQVMAGKDRFTRCRFADGREAIVLDAKMVSCSAPTEPSRTPTGLQADDVALLRRMDRYMGYSLGVYGWPMTALAHPTTWCCRLAEGRCCGGLGAAENTVGEMCCRCNVTALRDAVGVDANVVDVVTFSMCNTQEFTPYALAVDHDERCIVVALRGTMSVQDVITDARAEVSSLREHTDEVEGVAHRGMLRVALNVKQDIEQRGYLRDLRRRYSDYGIVFTGHSLGAGGAALLTVLYHKEYPDVECFAFSPPGALVSDSVARWSDTFITSVVFGKDVVPRLSLGTIAKLRDQVVGLLERFPATPKYKVLGTCGCARLSEAELAKGDEELPEAVAPTSPLATESVLGCSVVTSSREKRTFGSSRASGGARESELRRLATRLWEEKRRSRMYLPGKVLHFLRDGDRAGSPRCCGTAKPRPYVQPVWRKYSEFTEILISHRMILDHMPYNNAAMISRALEQVSTGALTEFPKTEPLIAAAAGVAAAGARLQQVIGAVRARKAEPPQPPPPPPPPLSPDGAGCCSAPDCGSAARQVSPRPLTQVPHQRAASATPTPVGWYSAPPPHVLRIQKTRSVGHQPGVGLGPASQIPSVAAAAAVAPAVTPQWRPGVFPPPPIDAAQRRIVLQQQQPERRMVSVAPANTLVASFGTSQRSAQPSVANSIVDIGRI